MKCSFCKDLTWAYEYTCYGRRDWEPCNFCVMEGREIKKDVPEPREKRLVYDTPSTIFL